MKKNRIIIAGSILLILLLLFLPITIPMSIEVPCKTRPVYSWVLKLENNGNLVISTYNFRTGTLEDYFSYVPDRGDNYGFTLTNKNSHNIWVNKGDTLGVIKSNLTSLQMAELSGRLAKTKGTLNLLLTGEKVSLVNYAQEQLNAAIEKSKYLNTIYGRKKALFDEGLLSNEELETFKSEARLSDIDVSVKRANLESVTSGEKSEQINLVRSEIKSIETEMSIIQQKLNSYIITAPFEGNITSNNSIDTILSISSKEFVLLVPVNWKYKSLIKSGLKVDLLLDRENPDNFEIENIKTDVQMFNGQQALISVARSKTSTYNLPENLWLRCSINLGDFSILEFIKWKLQYSYEL